MSDSRDLPSEKIRSFADLPVGWHYGEGVPATKGTIDRALVLESEFHKFSFRKTNAFPGIDGEIRVTAYYQSIYVEMTLEISGSVSYIYEFANEEIESEELTFDEALAKIADFRGKIWALSGLSIFDTTTLTWDDFKASLSETLATTEAYLSLIENAVYKPPLESANILKSSTEKLPEHRQLSGKSHPNYSLMAVSSSQSLVIPGTLVTTT